MKILILFACVIFSTVASAGGNHGHDGDVTNVTNVYPTEIVYYTDSVDTGTASAQATGGTTGETVIIEGDVTGIAAAMASGQLQFDWYTDDLQIAGSLANFENNTAGSVGVGKRISKILLNGSYARESDVDFFAISATMRVGL